MATQSYRRPKGSIRAPTEMAVEPVVALTPRGPGARHGVGAPSAASARCSLATAGSEAKEAAAVGVAVAAAGTLAVAERGG